MGKADSNVAKELLMKALEEKRKRPPALYNMIIIPEQFHTHGFRGRA